MPPPTRIAIIGLGNVAAAHLAALELVPGVNVVAGVNVNPARTLAFRGAPRPVLGSVAALSGADRPDAAVVTVPTAEHMRVCRELAAAGVPQALVEKPLVASRAELDALDAATGPMSVWPLLHFALADEVRWARERIGRWTGEHGPVVHAVQYYSDPYLPDLETRRRSLAGSWLDSGINALSVLATLAPLGAVEGAEPLVADPSEGVSVRIGLANGGTATVVTSWHARRSSKHTHLGFADGARAIIDHTAGTGLLVAAGALSEHFAPDDGLPSLVSHYVAVYRDWSAHGGEAPARLAEGRALLGLVFDAQERLEELARE